MPVFQWVSYFTGAVDLCLPGEDKRAAELFSLPKFLAAGMSGENGARRYPLTAAALWFFCKSKEIYIEHKRTLLFGLFFSTMATRVGLSFGNPSGHGVLGPPTGHVYPADVFGVGADLDEYCAWAEDLAARRPAVSFDPRRLDRRQSTSRCVGQQVVAFTLLVYVEAREKVRCTAVCTPVVLEAICTRSSRTLLPVRASSTTTGCKKRRQTTRASPATCGTWCQRRARSTAHCKFL